MSRADEDDEEFEVEDAKVIAATDLAFKVECPDHDDFWVPKSVIQKGSELEDSSEIGDEGLLVVATWWARKNDML